MLTMSRMIRILILVGSELLGSSRKIRMIILALWSMAHGSRLLAHGSGPRGAGPAHPGPRPGGALPDPGAGPAPLADGP